MKKIVLSFLFNFSLFQILADDCQYFFPINEVHKFADVLNIEGGLIAQKLNENQKWFNVATVLDLPFIDGVELEQLTTNNKFYLKESSIADYNELQTYFMHASLIKYCIDNAHKISNKTSDDKVGIIVQIHRGSSGIKYLKILEKIIEGIFPDFSEFKKIESSYFNEQFAYKLPSKISVSFRYGYEPKHYTDIQEKLCIDNCCDIFISISLVAGFNKQLKSGDIVAPIKFIPTDLDKAQMNLKFQYNIKNYFYEYLPDILNSQNHEVLNFINENFKSPNGSKKHHKAKFLVSNEIKDVTVLQVNKNFNPSTLRTNFFINK